jgi:hypothetical protein
VFVYDLGSASWALAFVTINTVANIPNATQSRFEAGASGASQVRSNMIGASPTACRFRKIRRQGKFTLRACGAIERHIQYSSTQIADNNPCW